MCKFGNSFWLNFKLCLLLGNESTRVVDEDGRSGNIPLWSNMAWTAMNLPETMTAVCKQGKSATWIATWIYMVYGECMVRAWCSHGWSTQMWLCSWNLEHVQAAVVPTDTASGCIWDPWPKGTQRQSFTPYSSIIWVLWALSTLWSICSILQTALDFSVSPADVLDWGRRILIYGSTFNGYLMPLGSIWPMWSHLHRQTQSKTYIA